jgi:hypothetical protein
MFLMKVAYVENYRAFLPVGPITKKTLSTTTHHHFPDSPRAKTRRGPATTRQRDTRKFDGGSYLRKENRTGTDQTEQAHC